MVIAETLFEALLEDYQTWDYFRQLPKYQNFLSVSIWIKGLLLYYELWGRWIQSVFEERAVFILKVEVNF
jgi:hypothetical protein